MKATKPNARTQKLSEPKARDFLCFAIYSANLAYGRAYKPILEELGLTYTQYIAIVALWEEDNQTVGSLGEKLFLESNTLTPILKKLETMGYLRRQRDAADERQVQGQPDRCRPALAGERLADESGGGVWPVGRTNSPGYKRRSSRCATI